MRIEVKGRKVTVTDELRAKVVKRFERVSKQVSPLAVLEVELSEGRSPESHVAEATLQLKGTTLRAREADATMQAAINHCADDLARQVKRRKEKQQNRRSAARAQPGPAQA